MSSRSDGLWVRFGLQVRDARLARRWTVVDLARRAGVSAGMIYRVEAGGVASTETATMIATALGRRAELLLIDPREAPRREARAGRRSGAFGDQRDGGATSAGTACAGRDR